MARLPDGDRPPADGALPPAALDGLGTRPFGLYVHVPFCAHRCGYCDYNTYVPGEAGPVGYVEAVEAELRLARTVLGDAAPAAQTVFVGGGAPTVLAPADLARMLGAVREQFGPGDGAQGTPQAK